VLNVKVIDLDLNNRSNVIAVNVTVWRYAVP